MVTGAWAERQYSSPVAAEALVAEVEAVVPVALADSVEEALEVEAAAAVGKLNYKKNPGFAGIFFIINSDYLKESLIYFSISAPFAFPTWSSDCLKTGSVTFRY